MAQIVENKHAGISECSRNANSDDYFTLHFILNWECAIFLERENETHHEL